jgi:hypothetical protein
MKHHPQLGDFLVVVEFLAAVWNFRRLNAVPISKRFLNSATVIRSREGKVGASPGSIIYTAPGSRLPKGKASMAWRYSAAVT